MIDKIENKINEELEKVINQEDLSLEDLKLLAEIKAIIGFDGKLNKEDSFAIPDFSKNEEISDEVVCSIR